jgi:hypothetical protein
VGPEGRSARDRTWQLAEADRVGQGGRQGGRAAPGVLRVLADVLDEKAPPDAQARLWDMIRATALVDQQGTPVSPKDVVRYGVGLGGLDWLLLTKRPERWEQIPVDVRPLVWLGTSISDAKTAAIWGNRLRAARGFAKLFFSAEPLVGDPGAIPLEGIDWVIVGGESGPAARPCDLAWLRSIVDQCTRNAVPVFVKQLGAVPVMDEATWRADPRTKLLSASNRNRAIAGTVPLATADKKGGDLAEWPADLRVRQYPVGVQP